MEKRPTMLCTAIHQCGNVIRIWGWVNLCNTSVIDTRTPLTYHVEGSVTLPQTRGIFQQVNRTSVTAVRSVAEVRHFLVQRGVHQATANTEIILLFYNWTLWAAGYRDVMTSIQLFNQSNEYIHDASHRATHVHFLRYFSHRFLLFWRARQSFWCRFTVIY